MGTTGGVGEGEHRQSEHVKEKAEESVHRGDRGEEEAARTVTKHRGQEHHEKWEAP